LLWAGLLDDGQMRQHSLEQQDERTKTHPAQSGEGLADAEQHCDGGAAIALGQSFPRGCLFRPSCALRKGLPEMRGNLAGAEGTYQVVAVG
jgi:hypothetical protein